MSGSMSHVRSSCHVDPLVPSLDRIPSYGLCWHGSHTVGPTIAQRPPIHILLLELCPLGRNPSLLSCFQIQALTQLRFLHITSPARPGSQGLLPEPTEVCLHRTTLPLTLQRWCNARGGESRMGGG